MIDIDGGEYIHRIIYDAGIPIQNVGCYDRASTKPQMNNYARGGNRERMEQYCNEQKWNVVTYGCDCCSGIYSDKKNRPVFYEMLENDNLDTIFVYSSDRFGRGVDVLFELRGKAIEHKKNIVFLESPTTQEFLEGMMSLFRLAKLIDFER